MLPWAGAIDCKGADTTVHTASQINSFSERSTLNTSDKGVQNLSTDKYRLLLIGDPHTLYEEYLV